jgi:hypothetical protein
VIERTRLAAEEAADNADHAARSAWQVSADYASKLAALLQGGVKRVRGAAEGATDSVRGVVREAAEAAASAIPPSEAPAEEAFKTEL